MTKVGRNEPCPCGSGQKFKRCCLGRGGPAVGVTADERASALAKLERFIENELGSEDDEAYDEFYGRWGERLDDLDDQWLAFSEAVYDMWFALDYRLSPGESPVDRFLAGGPLLTAGERGYLERLRGTAMRLYEIDDLSPGVSLTLRDPERGSRVTVRERLGSRSLYRAALVAARILDRGPSGQPEIERGFLHIPDIIRQSVVSQLATLREDIRSRDPRADETEVDKETAPFLHDAWMSCLLDPPVPQLKTTDGQDLLLTRVRFEVTDGAGLRAALDKGRELESEEQEPGVWHWSGKNQKGEEISLGRIILSGETLALECLSAERGDRGRAMIEALARDTVRHRSTTHENPAPSLRDRLRAGAPNEPEAGAPLDFSREEQEALTLDHLGRHYRKWVDEPVPALRDHTPREAAKDPLLRPRLIELIHQFEGGYEAALKRGAPAYDPSWMWSALGLPDRSWPAHPPPLAHERMASMIPGLGELCHTVAAQLRARPGFDDTATLLTSGEIATNLDIQRFLRTHAGALETGGSTAGVPDPAAEDATARLAGPIRWLLNFELHRRKTFWVDESLAYMLAKTDLDVPWAQLRAPFPCFALVFTDRHVLSLAERMLSGNPRCPVAGYRLRAVTVYVCEERSTAGRTLGLGLALDALGADPPHWVVQEIPLVEDASIEQFLDGLAPRVIADPPVPDAHPLRGLLHLTLNAILYAVSAGVEAQIRPSPGPPKRGAPLAFSSESVYFLPGAIEISRVRGMQELDRVPSGRGLLHRFMVRGHWRRPASSFKDQHLRWIAPYWKGPDMAAVIERVYRLEP